MIINNQVYYTVAEAAESVGVSKTRIKQLITENRVFGATKAGSGKGFWIMPANDAGGITILSSKLIQRDLIKITR